MVDNMNDVFSRVRRKPSSVREHEVLRLSGMMPSDDSLGVARVAIAEVLKWAKNRCGGHLPPEAKEHKSFEYHHAGRNISCIRFQTGDSNIWAIRADDPDKEKPRRVWTHEIIVGFLPSQPVKFGVRQLVSTPEKNLQIEPHTPGCVQQVAKICQLFCGPQLLSITPTVAQSVDDGKDLISRLIDPARRLPIFVVTLRKKRKNPTLNISSLCRAILGIGHVVLAHSDSTWQLTEEFGKMRSVFGGAVRIYMPGFSKNSDPYAHRLILADELRSSDGVKYIARMLRRFAARESIRQIKLGQDVPTFAEVQSTNLKLHQRMLKDKEADVSEQLATANARIATQMKQIESLESEKEYYFAEYEKERERAENSESQLKNHGHHIQHLIGRLKSQGDNPDQDVNFPSSWKELPDWCDKNLAGRLSLTRNARSGVRNPKFEDPEMVARCLLWLANECRERRIKGGSGSLSNDVVMKGIKNSPCGDDEYEFTWKGKKFRADWHIKKGGNTRDPSRCLRIYYCFDPQDQQIIVSDMPAHRRTAAS